MDKKEIIIKFVEQHKNELKEAMYMCYYRRPDAFNNNHGKHLIPENIDTYLESRIDQNILCFNSKQNNQADWILYPNNIDIKISCKSLIKKNTKSIFDLTIKNYRGNNTTNINSNDFDFLILFIGSRDGECKILLYDYETINNNLINKNAELKCKLYPNECFICLNLDENIINKFRKWTQEELNQYWKDCIDKNFKGIHEK